MKRSTPTVAISMLTAAIAACVAAPAARGGLFAAVNYSQNFTIVQPIGGGGAEQSSAPPVTGTTLPVQVTDTLSLPYVSGSVAYAFTDDGTTAALRINCQGQITVGHSAVAEPGGDFITLSQPATYVATFTDTGSGLSDLEFESGTLAYNFEIEGGGTMTHTGMLPAGLNFQIQESWDLDNSSFGAPASISGIESLSIVFTAVPEPASAGLVAAAGAVLVSRRRRLGRSG